MSILSKVSIGLLATLIIGMNPAAEAKSKFNFSFNVGPAYPYPVYAAPYPVYQPYYAPPPYPVYREYYASPYYPPYWGGPYRSYVEYYY